MSELPPGVAPVKPEYIISVKPTVILDDDSAEASTNQSVERVEEVQPHAGEKREAEEDAGKNGEPPAKKAKLSGAERKRLAREEKKEKRGANKNRKFGMVKDELDLCWKLAMGNVCQYGDKCKYTHDFKAYLSTKARDLIFPSASSITSSSPFVTPPTPSPVDPDVPSVDFTTKCPEFEEQGLCRAGLKCRFLGGHAKKLEDGMVEVSRDEEREKRLKSTTQEMNFVSMAMLRAVRSKKYPTPVTDEYLKTLVAVDRDEKKKDEMTEGTYEGTKIENGAPVAVEVEVAVIYDEQGNKIETAIRDITEAETQPRPQSIESTEANPPPTTAATTSSQPFDESQNDSPDVPLRPIEKKRLHWEGKTYLAPLTTVGNLPFRRLCTTYGADITCGEMGLAPSFLNSSKEEWSLVRRHPSEQTFGIQLAGNKPQTLVKTAEIMARNFGGWGVGDDWEGKEVGSGSGEKSGAGGKVDFVDLNCGCPIDLVFKNGAGSALLDQSGKLGKILVGMNRALGEIPLTLKIRTGVKDGRNTAHKLMPRLGKEWGVGAITIHGRSRQQRYTKLADWDYIKTCVETLRNAAADDDLPPIPIFGGGDCYSSQSYWESVQKSGVDGVMVARGALIKPWIFTEIKERREWDISSTERLEGIRKLAEFGLNHFGADTAGLNTTRRYLCEALSFQYRYVPIGLLERLPGKMNERPPVYRGRDELETLLASPDSRTWVKISEMFLGPAPEKWSFTPKHKSNAHGDEEGQG